MEQVPPCRSDFAPWNRKLLSVMQLPVRCWREIVTDVGHKPGREKTARYIADNVLDPAPAKGATYRFDHGNSELTGFNPRTRKGCDVGWLLLHSSPRCFNPRPREGCDFVYNDLGRKAARFQSTPP